MHWMWIDKVVDLERGRRLVAIKHVSRSEDHLCDHFPTDKRLGREADPIMPACLIIEGIAQSSGILLGHADKFRHNVILAKVSRAEFSAEARPGDTLRYTVTIDRLDPQGAAITGHVELLDPTAARPPRPMGRVDLILSYADNSGAKSQLPDHNFVFGESFMTLLRTSGYEV